MGYLVGYIDKPSPRLFNIFEIPGVETPVYRPVSAYALPFSVINISNE